MGAWVAFDHSSPAASTAGDEVPGEALARAENVLHQLMIAGDGDPFDWKRENYFDGGLRDAGELVDEVQWRRNGTDEMIRATITRDGGTNLIDEIEYHFSINAGGAWTALKKRVYTRASDGLTISSDWAAIT